MRGNSEWLRIRRARMAAVLAMSNLGATVPDDAGKNPERWTRDPVRELEAIAGHLMESDYIERIWADEARMWYTYVCTMRYIDIMRTHADNLPALYDIADAVEPRR